MMNGVDFRIVELEEKKALLQKLHEIEIIELHRIDRAEEFNFDVLVSKRREVAGTLSKLDGIKREISILTA